MKVKIKSDRELDALVAEHVMGLDYLAKKDAVYDILKCDPYTGERVKNKWWKNCDFLPHFSTDGNDMINLIHTIIYGIKCKDGYWPLEISGYDDGTFSVGIHCCHGMEDYIVLSDKEVEYRSLPKAVCLAALKSKGIEVEYD